uniref:Uncharacterized protein n=1 Tax=Cacopsylla melanoneura TaxID=428564 RepID=A0A8D9ABK9_9HEMI
MFVRRPGGFLKIREMSGFLMIRLQKIKTSIIYSFGKKKKKKKTNKQTKKTKSEFVQDTGNNTSYNTKNSGGLHIMFFRVYFCGPHIPIHISKNCQNFLEILLERSILQATLKTQQYY